ncbi:hypothetical protein Golax_006722, partial [Gossypium laxum]|nr:hypothetical protein [Gossypium laxum]
MVVMIIIGAQASMASLMMIIIGAQASMASLIPSRNSLKYVKSQPVTCAYFYQRVFYTSRLNWGRAYMYRVPWTTIKGF